jgi:hypothetical protein
MSDNWFHYVPSDTHFQPTVVASERAMALLHTFLPDAEEVTTEFFDDPAFIEQAI